MCTVHDGVLQIAIPGFRILKSRCLHYAPGAGTKMSCTAHLQRKDLVYQFEQLRIAHPSFTSRDLWGMGQIIS